MSLLSESEVSTIVSFFVGVIFSIYLLGDQPYKKAYLVWWSCFVQLAGLSGLFAAMYYRSMKGNTPVEVRTLIVSPSLFVLVMLISVTVASMAIILYRLGPILCSSVMKDDALLSEHQPNNEPKKTIIQAEEIHLTEGNLIEGTFTKEREKNVLDHNDTAAPNLWFSSSRPVI